MDSKDPLVEMQCSQDLRLYKLSYMPPKSYATMLNPSLHGASKPHPPIFHCQNHYRNIYLDGLLAREIHGRRKSRNPYNRRATPFSGTAPLISGHLFGHFDTGEAELVVAGSCTCTSNSSDRRKANWSGAEQRTCNHTA